MSTVFLERYKKLNSAQKEAVDTIEGPVMVIAGPGTGKTSILTLRIAHILQKTDTPAGAILAITYTEAGVRAMRTKLREIIGDRAQEVRIHTFHGFATSIIHEFADHFPAVSQREQLTEIDATEIIRDILKHESYRAVRPLGEPDFYVGKIIHTISSAKREAQSPAMVEAFARAEIERIKADDTSYASKGKTKGLIKGEAQKRIDTYEKTILFSQVYREYEDKKREQKKIDFDDLIIELLMAFKNDELLLRLIQEKFLYIHIDEHQDTNDAQNMLIRLITDFFENPNIFIVGDEKQAIFRFQGASVENFLKFQTVWKSMKVISLTTNDRSHQHILDASFSLIEKNYKEGEHQKLRIKLNAGIDTGKQPLEVIYTEDTLSGEAYVIESLKTITTKNPGATCALIVRTNREVERLMGLLERADIEAVSEKGVDVFSHPVGRAFFNLIRFVSDISEIEAGAKTLVYGLWNVSFENRAKLIKLMRAGLPQEITQHIPELSYIAEKINQMSPVEFIVFLAETAGITRLALRDHVAMEVWRALSDLSFELTRKSSLTDPRALITSLIAHEVSAEHKTIKVSQGSPHALVRITTAHGAKGLEYDYVYIPYASESSWIPRPAPTFFKLPLQKSEGEEVLDSRRLFYVALTRARKHVIIVAPGEAVRFIDECDSSYIEKKILPKAEYVVPEAKSIDWHKQRDMVALLDYVQQNILEKGLSVTALNHFCTCPSAFLYKSILKVPEAPSASSEKGNAMHLALSRMWALKTKDVSSLTETLTATIDEYFSTSLLSLVDKRNVIAELKESAPIVARSLLGHFTQEGTVRTEGRTETLFMGSYKGTPLSVNLHGRLDAVLEQGNHIKVYDYKTMKALTEAAIKGETKDSTGDYFRQLVFYKILLGGQAQNKNKTIEPSLVFVKPHKGECASVTVPVELSDIDRVKTEIQKLIDSVWSGDVLTTFCDDDSCEWCALKKQN